MKILEISCNAVEFFSDRDKVLLVVDEIGLTEELGFRRAICLPCEENESSDEIVAPTVVVQVPAVEWILILTTVVSEGDLCLTMYGYPWL